MYEDEIVQLASNSRVLRFKFRGVFSADAFPTGLAKNTFIIVNTDPSHKQGQYWCLFLRLNDHIMFADPLGKTLDKYPYILKRLFEANNANIVEILAHSRLQPELSVNCGLYCLYIAFNLFKFGKIYAIDEIQLLRFVKFLY